jgi:hypothetical protein
MVVWLILLFAAMALVGGTHYAVRARRARRARRDRPAFQPGQYALSHSVFTPAERSFYGVLVGLELPGVRILAKVRLADVFRVRRQSAGLGWRPAFAAISQKHVDFLLVREEDCCPVLGIELDDGSHRRPDRVERDRFVRALFSDCGLPLMRVPAQRLYTPAAVRRWVYEASPINFPMSGFVQTLTDAVQPGYERMRVRLGR